MAKKTKKQAARSEKDNAGCMSGLISIFDFRQGHSTRRLLSDRRHGSARHAGAAGNGHSTRKLNLLTSSEDKLKSLNDVDNIERRLDLGTSVKILMEEEMSTVKQTRKTPKADTEPSRCPEVSYEKNHRKANETSVLSCELHLNDKSREIPDKSNNQNKTERFPYDNFHIAELLEEICGDRHQCQRLLMDFKSIIDSSPSQKSTSEVPSGFGGHPDAQAVQDHSTIHKVVIEIAEALINRDLKAILSETSHQSEELINALKALNSDELLLKLLQDPCSLPGKHSQELKNEEGKSSKDSKPESCKLLEESNASSRQCEESISHKMSQNVHKIFGKKGKLQEGKTSNGNDGAQSLNKIVVLKPTPPRIQSSYNAISPSTSQCASLRAEAKEERAASHFSLKEIKRRLKHVIGDNRKGEHILSMDGLLHRIPYKAQQSGDSGGKSKDGGQTMSASKTSNCRDQTPQVSPSSKKKDKRLKLKESQSSIMHEDLLQDKNLSMGTTTSLHKEYNFQREARKHLLEMFNIVDSESNLQAMQISKPLGRILSLSEYSFLSPRSPGREQETSLSPRRMRFSPLWQSKQENGKHSSQLSESTEASPSTGTDGTLDQVCDSNPNTQGEGNLSTGGITRQEYLSSGEISSPKGCRENVEPLNTEHMQEKGFQNVASKLDDEPTDEAERSEEEISFWSPRATSPEMSQTVTLLVPSIPITLLIDNIGSPDSIIEKPERPSPVSVLEPLFTEDAPSPADSADEHVDSHGQPRCIHFEEHENSALVLTLYHESNRKTCMVDKECRYEYVRAVLEASCLMRDGLSDRWHSSSPLLDPSLYDEVEYSSDEFPDDLRQLFDSINEVLEVLREKFFSCTPWVSFAKPIIQPIPSGESFIKEVWKRVDQYFLSESLHTLDQIVGKDMEVGTWMDLRSGTESIGIDIGDTILDHIIEETLLELWD